MLVCFQLLDLCQELCFKHEEYLILLSDFVLLDKSEHHVFGGEVLCYAKLFSVLIGLLEVMIVLHHMLDVVFDLDIWALLQASHVL